MSIRIQINTDRIIYEIVEDEVLIIDSATGVYHLLSGSGAEIWQMISQGVDTPTLWGRLAQHYALPVAEVQPPVQRFLNDLQESGLVTLEAEQANDTPPLTADAQPQPGQTAAVFVAPELHSFSDMHNLLLIDPIHEVAETGWPFTPVQKR